MATVERDIVRHLRHGARLLRPVRFGRVSRGLMHPPCRRLVVNAGLVFSLLIATGVHAATELRDAELVPSGSPVLQNGTGTVRLEDSRLGRLGPPVFIPEPGVLWQLGSGIGLLALLARRRNRHIRTAAAEAPGRVNPSTAKGTMT